jgi:hypothetical protein
MGSCSPISTVYLDNWEWNKIMLSTRERTDTWTVVGIWREGRYFGVRGIEKYSRRHKYKASSAVIPAIHKTAVRGLSTSIDEYDSGPSWYIRNTDLQHFI